ncbi:hypothetical protein QP888_06320 [Corynebacterium sp. MSK297]|uniref:hypothetical protein n=1 Tax=Corynebacterium sp. MSK297 TaxID=3050221 RepID=UPI002551437F|nr:hypothetical protein [Corynebacterium sp. MSK297]MDK8846126.1 hypothetical protein [Corynebacterium sp. MSK297]
MRMCVVYILLWGYTWTKEEQQDIYYLWKVAGRMVGVPETYGIACQRMQQILEFSTPTVAERFDLLRKNPGALEEEIARNEQLIIGILDPEAAYLKQDDGVVVKDAA